MKEQAYILCLSYNFAQDTWGYQYPIFDQVWVGHFGWLGPYFQLAWVRNLAIVSGSVAVKQPHHSPQCLLSYWSYGNWRCPPPIFWISQPAAWSHLCPAHLSPLSSPPRVLFWNVFVSIGVTVLVSEGNPLKLACIKEFCVCVLIKSSF